MWVTWPLSRFGESQHFLSILYRPREELTIELMPTADGIASQSIPYTSSLTLIRQLLDTLTTYPPLPSQLSGTSDSAKNEKAKEDKTRPRPTSEQLQASLSLLAVQPLLPGKPSDWSSEGWEELLSVEVGGWGEK